MASVSQKLDAYPSALGLVPGNVMVNNQGYFQPDAVASVYRAPSMQETRISAPGPEIEDQTQGSISLAEISQVTQLGNWYSRNQHILELLEKDMFQFNPNA